MSWIHRCCYFKGFPYFTRFIIISRNLKLVAYWWSHWIQKLTRINCERKKYFTSKGESKSCIHHRLHIFSKLWAQVVFHFLCWDSYWIFILETNSLLYALYKTMVTWNSKKIPSPKAWKIAACLLLRIVFQWQVHVSLLIRKTWVSFQDFCLC